MNSIRFSVFADLHYKKKMYPAKVCDLTAITDRARSEGAELILHAGDFCNDYAHSPEILTEYLSCELPVFGVYGNHELESNGNSMENVTPCLTNSPKKVVWGTENGDIGNGNIAYYYYDSGCFRFILLDTNYSLIPDGSGYEHNRP
ncbi:MAG: metallophosphoesterase, partial [Clostridia bacterium]|nr:metallophosphoesterase [Clostridia bacterium]